MNVRSFGPETGGTAGEWARLKDLVPDDPDAVWSQLLEIVATTDDSGLFWVADILEDLVAHDPQVFEQRIEGELASNRRFRQAFVHFVPMGHDEAVNDRLLTTRERIEDEIG
jgi:hypothetical protein